MHHAQDARLCSVCVMPTFFHLLIGKANKCISLLLMLKIAIDFIVDEMNAIIEADPDTVAMEVKQENVSRVDNSTDTTTDEIRQKVILTLVNTEEEKTMKNNTNYIREGEVIKKLHPALFINLYLLFSCADKDYSLALGRISKVIEIFQKQNVFVSGSTIKTMPPGIEKLIFEFCTLSFEQQNHLWGMLGGKQMPAVVYKVRLVVVQDRNVPQSSVVKSLHLNEGEN